ncbi:hypothetical protein SLEP1_g32774 [Rubroshorea leprosula]|uniref:Uncharacterized protein n=1 Tax=Rubroshorea leprosula TaxID=152421 RepID=A0AAV5KEF6_9ROSI|nr:hypothetical protein SLEP1_g32774 [Rubroshorea leprosula]
MDAYQQQLSRYMRPPPPQPPPAMVPQHQYHRQYPQPPRAPIPQGSWHSNQFQYQHRQSHSSPSPPPPLPPPPQVPSQWGPPPNSGHSTYAPPPPHPYPGNQFTPPHHRPHLPPPQIPHSYPQVNQEWSHRKWSYRHGWDHSGLLFYLISILYLVVVLLASGKIDHVIFFSGLYCVVGL